MPPAPGSVFGIVTQMQKCVITLVRFEPDIAPAPAITARRPAARDKFFPPKSRHSISAVTGFDSDFYLVNKHCIFRF
jgi:hypothetical protein